MRPLRIAVDAHVLDGKPQGSRTWLRETLARAIPAAGEIRWLLHAHDSASLGPLAALPNVEFRPIPYRRSIARLGLYWPRVIATREADFHLFQYHGPPVYRERQILVLHDLLFESHPDFFPPLMRKRLQTLVRSGARRAAALLTVSDWTRDEIARRYALPAGRVFLAPNGAPSFRGGRAGDGRTVLFVGRIEPRKNLGLLLDALDLMRTPHRRLIVIGRPDFGADAVIARMAGRGDYAFLPDASDKVLAGWYRRAGVLAYPSRGEGFGIPLVEALSLGLPVVASRATAIPEVAGPFARYFDPEAVDAAPRLAHLLDEALADTAPPATDAIARHLSRFTWEKSAEGLLAAISHAADQRTARRAS
ncbi:glycosyl transferase family 1 [Haematobacter missouriensis]|uniref:Glycosyl transferase family 1 n=1 Tax=Haematobacter missouriensis TaxID=366616 RepID=A0A212AIN5_9RHOB|nr:glycosyltransferase family 1 protein [Haematobacter missouriensis]OWJ81285.1 glycosyl transferase family 1 [Haematobacter missouriensis]